MPPLPRLGALRSLTGTTATESSALLAAERVVAGTRPRSRRTGAAVGGRRAACARLLALARLTLMGASSGILRTAAGVAAVTGLVGTRAGEGAALP